MRLLLVNVCVILLTCAVIKADNTADKETLAKHDAVLSRVKSSFLKNNNNIRLLIQLVQEHFDNSLKYLFSSKQYGSQYVERPGLAKYLLEASDKQWKNAFDVLKKFLQRGGTFEDGNFIFNVTGKGELSLYETADISDRYVSTLRNVLDDSLNLSKNLNKLYLKTFKNQTNFGDLEISHYLTDKLEEEAERTRELAGHVVTLQKMNSLGVALHLFDSHF
nr:uncharacterized protein LOC123755340 [Procambarus clarkii]